jgi:diguanylate cyclase (GGDEF)-like protein/PAS domain S-box-containing protein
VEIGKAERADDFDFRDFFFRSLDLFCIADLGGVFRVLNGAWEQTLGYSCEELCSRPYLDFVHPHDRDATLREMRALAEGATTISFENRYRKKDGGYRDLLWTASSDSEKGLVYATARDVSERKTLEEELVVLHAAMRSVTEAPDLDSAIAGVVESLSRMAGWVVGEAWLPSDDGDDLLLSPAWFSVDDSFDDLGRAGKHLRSMPGEGLIGRAWQERSPIWICDIAQDPTFERIEPARALGIGAAAAIPVLAGDLLAAVLVFFKQERCDQDDHFLSLATTIAGQLATVILRRRAEDRMKEMAYKFRELSLRDELTGLYNRRGFTELARHHFAIADREGQELTLMYLDLDAMKSINDTYGHGEGDRALERLGAILKRATRDSEVVARVGGDEFCILLDAEGTVADIVADRIRKALAEHDSEGSRPYDLKLSIGAATRAPKSETTLEDLMELADLRMYRSKGRIG